MSLFSSQHRRTDPSSFMIKQNKKRNKERVEPLLLLFRVLCDLPFLYALCAAMRVTNRARPNLYVC